MRTEPISATQFSRNVATYLDHVRHTGETVIITKGSRIVAELTPPQPSGLPIAELASLIAHAPKLGDCAQSMIEDLQKIRHASNNNLENPWD